MAVKKIILVGEELCIRKEGIAGGTVTPGHLVQGPATAIIVHGTAAGTAQKAFCYEREMTGDGIDVDYAASDTILYAVCPPGTVIWALADATGITAEDFVESNGDGTFQVVATSAATADTSRNSVVGKALTTAAANARFQLEVY